MWNVSPIAARIADQAVQPDGEILGVRHRPHRRAVTRNDDGFAARDAFDDGPVAGKRRPGVVVGVRGTDDGDREPAVGIGGVEHVLRLDLLACVEAERVVPRRRLDDRPAHNRLAIHRGGADVDVVVGQRCEHVDRCARLVGGEDGDVDDRVEMLAGQRIAGCGRVAGVRLDERDAVGQRAYVGAQPAVEDRDLHPGRRRRSHTRGADRPRPSDVQH